MFKTLSSNLKLKPTYLVPVLIIFAGLGAALLIRSFANTDGMVAFESEQGSVSGNAVTKDDGAASGGKFVLFRPTDGSPTPPPSTTTPPTPTPPPSSGDWPNASNTGPRVQPTKTYNGAHGGAGDCHTINEDMDGYIFNYCVKTGKHGLKITNSIININGSSWGFQDAAGGAQFEYNYVVDKGKGAQSVMCGNGTRIYRNNLKGSADGLKCTTNSQIIENYVHDLSMYNTSSGGTHNDYIQALGGSGLTIKGNTFATSCNPPGGCNGIILQNSHKNSTIEGNYFERYDGSTTGFAIHLTLSSGVTVKNNIFNCAQHKPKFGAPLGISGGIDGGGNRCQ